MVVRTYFDILGKYNTRQRSVRLHEGRLGLRNRRIRFHKRKCKVYRDYPLAALLLLLWVALLDPSDANIETNPIPCI